MTERNGDELEPDAEHTDDELAPNTGDEAEPNAPADEPDTHRDAGDDEADERVEREPGE